MVPFFKTNISPNAYLAVKEVLESGYIGEGQKVQEFTKTLASQDWFDNPNIICTNSCTTSLVMALKLAGVKHGDVVLTPDYTFPGTTCAVLEVGGVPVFADFDKTLCVSLSQIEQGIEKHNPVAVIVTLTCGLVPDKLEDIVELLALRKIPLIFDAAHAVLTFYKGKHISHWCDFGCFSFQSIKQLTCGDGGALTIKDSEQISRASRMKFFGMTRGESQSHCNIEEFGGKWHLNDVAAAIGLANMSLAKEFNSAAFKNAETYKQLLKPEDLPLQVEGVDPSWWIFPTFILNSSKKNSTTLWVRQRNHSAFSGFPVITKSCFGLPICFPVGPWVSSTEIKEFLC